MTIKTLPLKSGLKSGFAALLTICTLGSSALADDAPAGVTLRGFSYAGSGCSADTVTGNFPADGNEFQIIWGSFTAEVGPGVPMRDKRKNCQVLLDLAIPAGWQYTVESIEYHGDVEVEAGVEAIAGSSHYFQGDATTVRFNTLFEGPENRTFQVIDVVGHASQVWSPCGGGRALNVNYQVRLDAIAEAGVGRVSFGDPNGVAGTRLALEWRRCSAE